MIYFLLKVYSRFLLSLYFDKIMSTGMDKLDHGKPVILVSNHPSAFTEPIILVNLISRSLYFMVRGDYFFWWNKWFFKIIHLVPIYRKSLSEDSYSKNQDTFFKTSEYLSENKVICILAEGSTSEAKKVRPLEKGFARMAFAAYEAGVKDITIHAVANNFGWISRLGSRGSHLCSDPIEVAPFVEEHKDNPQKGIRELHLHVSEVLSAQIVDIAHRDDFPVREAYLDYTFETNRPKAMRTFYPTSDFPEKEISASRRSEIPPFSFPQETSWLNLGRILTAVFYLLYWPLLFFCDFIARSIPLKKEFLSGLRLFSFMLFFGLYGLLLSLLFLGGQEHWYVYVISIIGQHFIMQFVMYYWYSDPSSPLHPYHSVMTSEEKSSEFKTAE